MTEAEIAAIRWLRRLLDVVAAGLLAAILTLTTAGVVARYVLGVAMPWNAELSRLLFIWLVLIAAARVPHLRIDLLPAAVNRTVRRWLEVAVRLVCLALLGVLVWGGFGMIELTAFDTFTALGVSVQYLYWAVVVCGSLWFVTTILDLVAPSDTRVVPD